jgi:tetratricopeptide (TPR) repeat protein
MTAEDWLTASLRANQAGAYQQSIDDARAALKLRPDFPEAYNNIAAAYEAMHKWDEAIAAAKQAIRLKPDFQLAKNNLEWSISQKKLGVR